MRKTSLFVAIFIVALVSVVSVGFTAPTSVSAAYMSCTNLTANLYVGSTDSTTAGQVSALQSFLTANNFLVVYGPTGYFADATGQAIRMYQTSRGLYPSGTIDVATRAAIYNESCNNYSGYNNYNNYNNGYFYGNYNVTPYYNTNYSNNYCGAGYYGNTYGNSYYNPCRGGVEITDIDGPTRIKTNKNGEWSIDFYNPSKDRVSVRVYWGDEGRYYDYDDDGDVKSTSTKGDKTFDFTHKYRNRGYYTITFIVTDSWGAETRMTTAVNVIN